MLNVSRINDAEKARVNVRRSPPIWVNETIVHGRAAPIFAPIAIGIAPSNGIAPVATIATDILVVADELCIKAVRIIPKHNPVNGFFSWAASVSKIELL